MLIRRMVFKSHPRGNRFLKIVNDRLDLIESTGHFTGTVIWAASPSLADVQAAIALASPGDTVRVPAGNATWTSQLGITKGINIIGAGAGSTVITAGFDRPNPGNTLDPANYFLYYHPSSPSSDIQFELSGFTIDCAYRLPLMYLYNSSLTMPLTKTKIHHNTTTRVLTYQFYAVGDVWGVVYSNTMDGGYAATQSIGNQQYSWMYRAHNLGSADYLYFEDNVVTLTTGWTSSPIAHGAAQGGRYVARNNTYNMNGNAYPLFDAHGNQPGSGAWATTGVEIYNNTVNAGAYYTSFLDQRGGLAIVFGNRVVGSYAMSTKVREEYDDRDQSPPENVISGQPMHVSGSYYWDNLFNSSTRADAYIDGQVDYGGAIGLVPQENVDFWNQQTSFDGSIGMGSGLLSARPSSGLTIGVGYWATDTQTLYRATSATTWETYFQPYTYPHPLRT